METIRQARTGAAVLNNPGVDRDLKRSTEVPEKDPHCCYASAEALADGSERWLRHEPTLARPSADGNARLNGRNANPSLRL